MSSLVLTSPLQHLPHDQGIVEAPSRPASRAPFAALPLSPFLSVGRFCAAAAASTAKGTPCVERHRHLPPGATRSVPSADGRAAGIEGTWTPAFYAGDVHETKSRNSHLLVFWHVPPLARKCAFDDLPGFDICGLNVSSRVLGRAALDAEKVFSRATFSVADAESSWRIREPLEEVVILVPMCIVSQSPPTNLPPSQ